MQRPCEICLDISGTIMEMTFNTCGCVAHIHPKCMTKWEEKHKDGDYLPCPKCMKPIIKMKCYCYVCAYTPR